MSCAKEQLNQMTEDRVSRILDLSGGDRVMQELVLDLAGRPDRSGAKVPPTVQHMTKVWLGAFERSSEDNKR